MKHSFLLIGILCCLASWQRPPDLKPEQIDSILEEAGLGKEFWPYYNVFLDSTQLTDTSPYTYKYTIYEGNRIIYQPNSEEIKFRTEEERWRSWRKPAAWILVVIMIFFARWAYKEIRRYNRGRLVVEDEPDESILYDMPEDDPRLRD